MTKEHNNVQFLLIKFNINVWNLGSFFYPNRVKQGILGDTTYKNQNNEYINILKVKIFFLGPTEMSDNKKNILHLIVYSSLF